MAEQNRSAFFIVLGFYLCWMLGIAYVTRQRNLAGRSDTKDASYRQHFLGSKGYGSILLFLTLFSTIYSGYTLVGVPTEASKLGFFATRWLSSAPMVGIATIIFVPRIRRLSVVSLPWYLLLWFDVNWMPLLFRFNSGTQLRLAQRPCQ